MKPRLFIWKKYFLIQKKANIHRCFNLHFAEGNRLASPAR